MIGEQTLEGRRENLNQANKLSRTYRYPSVLFYHHSTFTVGDDSAGAAVRYGVCSSQAR